MQFITLFTTSWYRPLFSAEQLHYTVRLLKTRILCYMQVVSFIHVFSRFRKAGAKATVRISFPHFIHPFSWLTDWLSDPMNSMNCMDLASFHIWDFHWSLPTHSTSYHRQMAHVTQRPASIYHKKRNLLRSRQTVFFCEISAHLKVLNYRL